LADILSDLGYDVDTAYDGITALSKVQSITDPHIVRSYGATVIGLSSTAPPDAAQAAPLRLVLKLNASCGPW
jgi:CheY-like chemotaxis protein